MVTPTVEDLANRYCRLKSTAPGIEIVGAKRDIDAAFTRCRIRPDCEVLFGTEFTMPREPAGSVVFFYLVLPFGFTCSPCIFGRLIQGVQRFHQLH